MVNLFSSDDENNNDNDNDEDDDDDAREEIGGKNTIGT